MTSEAIPGGSDHGRVDANQGRRIFRRLRVATHLISSNAIDELFISIKNGKDSLRCAEHQVFIECSEHCEHSEQCEHQAVSIRCSALAIEHREHRTWHIKRILCKSYMSNRSYFPHNKLMMMVDGGDHSHGQQFPENLFISRKSIGIY